MMAVRIRVTGRVQGVFYRASTKTQADNLDITGWVMNEPEGAVLIHAEGADEKLEELISWCQEGPQFARVDNVEIGNAEMEHFESFEIRRY